MVFFQLLRIYGVEKSLSLRNEDIMFKVGRLAHEPSWFSEQHSAYYSDFGFHVSQGSYDGAD